MRVVGELCQNESHVSTIPLLGSSENELRASPVFKQSKPVHSPGAHPPPSAPAVPQRSQPGTLLQPGSAGFQPAVERVRGHPEAVLRELATHRVFESAVQRYSGEELSAPADDQPVQPHVHLSHAGMDGSNRGGHGSHELAGPQHDQLSRSYGSRDALHVDTDLCLSLVNETRPSYEVKTAGKNPLSPQHLLSLVDPDASAYLNASPKSALDNSSSYSYSRQEQNSSSPSQYKYHYSSYSSSGAPGSNPPTPRAGNAGPAVGYSPGSLSTGSSPSKSTSYYASTRVVEDRTTSTTSGGSQKLAGGEPAGLGKIGGGSDMVNGYQMSNTTGFRQQQHSPAYSQPQTDQERFRHGTPQRIPSPAARRPASPGGIPSNAPRKVKLYETPVRFDTDALFREFELDLRRRRSMSPARFVGGKGGSRPPSITDEVAIRPVGYTRSMSNSSYSLARRPATPPFIDPLHEDRSRHSSYVSPRARGMVPAPSDQPIRNPKQHGLEGQVDHLTIEMYRNMMSGYGAAGDNNCAKCGQGIGGGRPGCTALGQTFHLECFVCHVCNNRLAGGSFYSVEGKPYCEKDYMDTLDKCTVCNKPVTDRILRASGRPYHPTCFSCVACSKCLDGVPFTVDANNEVHCVECFHEKYAPRCARCSKPIVPEEGKEESMRVVAMDKSFHVDCYTCEDCGLSLNSKIEGRGCYPMDDHVLCKDCNVKRVQQLAK